MEMLIDFPGGVRVDAHFGGFTVPTDQPPGGIAPSPFTIFLSSLGTCAGFYVLSYCQKHNLPTEGIRLIERIEANPANGMVELIEIEVLLPPGFPEKYHEALIRSAELCSVKKHLEKPPRIEISTRVAV